MTALGVWFVFIGSLGLRTEARVIRAGSGGTLPWFLSFHWTVVTNALQNRDRHRDNATFWAITISMIAMYVVLIAFGILQFWLARSNPAWLG
jgi:Zn-dependent protease with chaperone function